MLILKLSSLKTSFRSLLLAMIELVILMSAKLPFSMLSSILYMASKKVGRAFFTKKETATLEVKTLSRQSSMWLRLQCTNTILWSFDIFYQFFRILSLSSKMIILTLPKYEFSDRADLILTGLVSFYREISPSLSRSAARSCWQLSQRQMRWQLSMNYYRFLRRYFSVNQLRWGMLVVMSPILEVRCLMTFVLAWQVVMESIGLIQNFTLKEAPLMISTIRLSRYSLMAAGLPYFALSRVSIVLGFYSALQMQTRQLSFSLRIHRLSCSMSGMRQSKVMRKLNTELISFYFRLSQAETICRLRLAISVSVCTCSDCFFLSLSMICVLRYSFSSWVYCRLVKTMVFCESRVSSSTILSMQFLIVFAILVRLLAVLPSLIIHTASLSFSSRPSSLPRKMIFDCSWRLSFSRMISCSIFFEFITMMYSLKLLMRSFRNLSRPQQMLQDSSFLVSRSSHSASASSFSFFSPLPSQIIFMAVRLQRSFTILLNLKSKGSSRCGLLSMFSLMASTVLATRVMQGDWQSGNLNLCLSSTKMQSTSFSSEYFRMQEMSRSLSGMDFLEETCSNISVSQRRLSCVSAVSEFQYYTIWSFWFFSRMMMKERFLRLCFYRNLSQSVQQMTWKCGSLRRALKESRWSFSSMMTTVVGR